MTKSPLMDNAGSIIRPGTQSNLLRSSLVLAWFGAGTPALSCRAM